MKKLKFYLYLMLPLFIFSFNACEDSGSSPVNIFSVQDDVTLGRQLDSTIRADSREYPVYNVHDHNQYVQNIVDEIIKSSLIQYKGTFVYKTQIIKNDSIVNAFALPGGYLYVYTGLLKFLDNEATLAGILAHEIAHAELRHATNRMTKAYGIELLLKWILGDNPNEYAQVAANLFSGLYLLKNSRDDEYQADEYSFKYLKSTKWYPAAIIYFFDKVKSNEKAIFLDVWLSTHPMPQDRVDAVKKLKIDNNIPEPAENTIFANKYNDFKKSLR